MHLQSLRIFIISLNANYRIAHLMPSRANDSFLRKWTDSQLKAAQEIGVNALSG